MSVTDRVGEPGVRLMLGDCLDRMAEIEDRSVHLIVTDLPYGVTACRWDVIIPFEPLWKHYRRVLGPFGAVVLTARQPFTSMLVMSNRKWFKYCLVWDKITASGALNAKRRPMTSHEDVVVFSPGNHTYHPQYERRSDSEIKRLSVNGFRDRASSGNAYGASNGSVFSPRSSRAFKNPKSIIRINGLSGKHLERGHHHTQKPVALMEYLIHTYSEECGTILDSCMGSGTTGIACINTNRNFIGIEKDPAIFAAAERRIAELVESTPLFAGASGGNAGGPTE
jgi:site-specific DNA-methyltransferase (adenine-specific)